MLRRALVPASVFALTAGVYVALLGEPRLAPSPNNHFVHLAESLLAGQLHVLGEGPPGSNDWALYQGRWYVSFPPFPALLLLPLVAWLGQATPDRLFWAIFAGLPPAVLYMLLRRLSERAGGARRPWENLLLTGLFAFGSVYFFSAVQGSVWFAAQIVASLLIMLYLRCALNAAHPVLAGLSLGCLLLTRPTTALLCIVFAVETLAVERPPESLGASSAHPLWRLSRWLSGARPGPVARAYLLFAVPILVCGGLQLWLNAARFDAPFAFGHEHLQIRWKARIATWGLFDYHYLGRNLAVMLTSLPWLSSEPPYVRISRHGLALWVTTPGLLWLLWPRTLDARRIGLYLAALAVALLDLCYQNSGWIQFGYRFALDYLPLLIVLLALGGRRFGAGFGLCALFAFAINAFGALTFDRVPTFYDDDLTQKRIFQPD